MQSNPMNTDHTHENPPAGSVSSLRDNPCLRSDSTTAALEVMTDDGISYLLPYAQFLYAERKANPTVEQEPAAPPEMMRIHFAQAEVVVLGSGLKRLADGIQKQGLQFVKPADPRVAASFITHVASITLTLTKENI